LLGVQISKEKREDCCNHQNSFCFHVRIFRF
jgi:hypothetical protein